MRRKMASILLTATMAVSLLAMPVAAAEVEPGTDDEVHEWDTENAETEWTEVDGVWTYTVEISCNTCDVVASAYDTPEGVYTEPTCTEKGGTKYTVTNLEVIDPDTEEVIATFSDEMIVGEEEALGHEWDTENAETAWTESDGAWTFTVNISCERCESVASASDTPEGVYTEPTCTEKGSTSYTVTDLAVTDPDTKEVIETFSDVKEVEEDALGHEWDTENAETAWTESDGAWTFTVNISCERCDTVASASDTPDGEVVSEPTCEEKGSTTYTVTDLAVTDPDTGEVIATFSDEKEVEEDALGHEWGDWEIVKEATIGEDGEKVCTCSRCGETQTDDYSVDIEALEKEYEELLAEKDEMNADDYTEESWNAFEDALEEAKAVLEDFDSTQEDIDEAYDNLKTAFEDLTEKEDEVLNGVCKADDGNWYYYVDGVVDTSYTGFATNENGSWYMENGELKRDKNTVIKDELGALGSTDEWYYVVGSKVQFDFTGLADYSNSSGWWYITDGKVDRSYNGMAENKNGLYYVTDGKVDRSYTGFAQNGDDAWYVTKGGVTYTDNTVIKDTLGALGSTSEWYYVIESKVQYDFTGLANYSNDSGWWYITDGKVDRSYNGLAKNKNGWYYLTSGKVDRSYTGFATNENGSWYMTKGKLTRSDNTVIKDTAGTLGTKGEWYYVVGSKVQYDFTGLANYKNDSGWWYITDGKVDRTVNTVAKNKNGWYYVTNGKVQKNFTGLAHYKNASGWWYIRNGKVDRSYAGIASNQNGSYYLRNGKVQRISGTVTVNGTTYTLNNGKVV